MSRRGLAWGLAGSVAAPASNTLGTRLVGPWFGVLLAVLALAILLVLMKRNAARRARRLRAERLTYLRTEQGSAS